MEIAGAVLDELKKEGKDPAKDGINLSVWAQQDAGKGMTGKPLTRPFGRTVYNYKSGRPEVASRRKEEARALLCAGHMSARSRIYSALAKARSTGCALISLG
jgi:hypothetical protein